MCVPTSGEQVGEVRLGASAAAVPPAVTARGALLPGGEGAHRAALVLQAVVLLQEP